MSAAEIFAANITKAERAYRVACAAVLLVETHWGRRDALVAREKARKNLELVKNLAARSQEREEADLRNYLSA